MSEKNNTNHTAKLHGQLWKIADSLRGTMDASEFKNYMLGFIFYKYLSEKVDNLNNQYLKEEKEANTSSSLPDNYSDLDENNQEHKEYLEWVKEIILEDLGYNLEPKELFSNLIKKGSDGGFILDDVIDVLKSIESSTMWTDSEDEFNHLFEAVDLTSSKLGKTENEKNKLVFTILSHLSEVDFALEDVNTDILGDAYEYLIGQFASSAGKKAGEFYTPQEVSTILARIVSSGKNKLKSVYDPTCGSGSLLLRVAKEVKEVGKFYGQEMNSTTYNLARMNMLLHDVHYSKFDIKNDDTLLRPQHLDTKFEAIVANPPFSIEWDTDSVSSDDIRFSQYGRLAPKKKADYAFVQHMVHQLDDNGTMAVVLPHGVLFRGAAEWVIREFLVDEKNYLDAVIWLPEKIFFGTGIPSVILVFKKCRKDDDKVLFIDASNDFEKVKKMNHIRVEDMDKIMDTYENRKEIEKYSHLASLDEIKENDFNLNIPRYVNTFEEEEKVDLVTVAESVRNIKKELVEVENSINKQCEVLGIDKLF